MRAVSNRTADTSTAAVRSSTAAARRSASVRAGEAATHATSTPVSASRGELAADAVELAVGGDQPGPGAPQVEAGEQPDHQLVRAGGQGDLTVRVVQQAAVAGAHLVGLGHGAVPLVVGGGRGVVERLGLPLAGHVGPRLVGMAGEEQPLGHPEPGVVRCQAIGGGRAGRRGWSQLRSGWPTGRGRRAGTASVRR